MPSSNFENPTVHENSGGLNSETLKKEKKIMVSVEHVKKICVVAYLA